MQRNIQSYTDTYLRDDYNFENIMVKMRRKKILEIINSYKPKNILEIGCGMDSIVNYYNDFSNFVIVEPSKKFAKQAFLDSKNIKWGGGSCDE